MDVKRIHKYFAEDYILSQGDLLDVENVLSVYPYFQSLRFLYLRACYSLDYHKFKEKLDAMAIFVSNREALFFYILKDEFPYPILTKKTVLNDDRTLKLIDAFFEETNTVIQEKLDIETSTKNLATTDYLSFLEGIEKKKSTKNQSKETVNISTGLITLETIEKKNTEDLLSIDQVKEETSTSEVVPESKLITLENTPPTDTIKPNHAISDLENTTDENEEVLIDNIGVVDQSKVLIESFNKLVERALDGNIDPKDFIEDEDEDDYDEDFDDFEIAITKDEGEIVLESDNALVTPLTNNVKTDLIELSTINEPKHSTESLIIEEEQIEEQEFNTIGSAEMSALITQRLEESLKMLQELRRSAMSAAKKKEAIIDDFLSKEYKPIVFNKSDIEKDEDSYMLEDENDEDELDEGFFTETLAKIYTKQGRYNKAYEIIKHLSLKVPNKNVYFVEQLDFLEKLISKKNIIK